MKTIFFLLGRFKLFYNVRSWSINCFFEFKDLWSGAAVTV